MLNAFLTSSNICEAFFGFETCLVYINSRSSHFIGEIKPFMSHHYHQLSTDILTSAVDRNTVCITVVHVPVQVCPCACTGIIFDKKSNLITKRMICH